MPRFSCWVTMTCCIVGCAAGNDGDRPAPGAGGAGADGAAAGGAAGSSVIEGGPGGTILVSDSGPSSGYLSPCDTCTDFPSAPIVDPSAPAGAAALFGSADSGSAAGGPCIVEPEPNTLFARNWLRPRIRFSAPAGQNVFEIRMHAARETSDLVVYTGASSWTMPQPIWFGLASHVVGEPITLTVRGVSSQGGSPASSAAVSLQIAPVEASGSLVYWATKSLKNTPEDTSLVGFHVGDEGVVTALNPLEVQQKVVALDYTNNQLTGAPIQVTCVGCHTSTPGGDFAAFTAQWPWPDALASLKPDGPPGAQPSWLTDVGRKILSPMPVTASSIDGTTYMLGIQTFSAPHWKDGEHIDVTTRGEGQDAKLVWLDLDAASDAQGVGWGEIARQGDARAACGPNWSHDGAKIVYASALPHDARMDRGPSDLLVVPYADRAGGAATPLQGAAENDFDEYYPAFSPDDALVAYNRVPVGLATLYNQPAVEVFVVPASGGAATRLVANDPPSCLGRPSPGVQNTWPKWAPEAAQANGKTYYFLIFSSIRAATAAKIDGASCPEGNARDDGCRSQLFVTALSKDAGGKLESYGAVYLWNQDPATNNLTPAWDVFKIPEYIPR